MSNQRPPHLHRVSKTTAKPDAGSRPPSRATRPEAFPSPWTLCKSKCRSTTSSWRKCWKPWPRRRPLPWRKSREPWPNRHHLNGIGTDSWPRIDLKLLLPVNFNYVSAIKIFGLSTSCVLFEGNYCVKIYSHVFERCSKVVKIYLA